MNLKLSLVTIISFMLLTYNLGSWGLTESSEARYAEISKEMLENNDFLHPKLMDIYHYHKPPITYYITTIGYNFFGVNEFGARFFLQLAIIFQILLIYSITSLLFNDKNIALASALIYFSLPLVLISSRNLTTDAYLNTFILSSIYFWLRYKVYNKYLFLYLFFIFLGITIETKGPVSLLFVCTFIIIYKIILKDKVKLNMHHYLGFTLFLIISLLWFTLVIFENDKVWDYFLKEQLYNRIATKSFSRTKPIWFYLLLTPLVGIPWFFFNFHYLIKKGIRYVKESHLIYILYLSILVIISLFSIFKTKLIMYVLPVFGFVAIASAKAIANVNLKTLRLYNTLILLLTSVILFSAFILNFINLNVKLSTTRTIIIGIMFTFFTLFITNTSFKVPFLKTAIISYTFGIILLILGNQFLYENQTELNSFKEVASFINTEFKETDNIVVYDYLIPSAMFYSDKDVITLNNGRNTVKREVQFEGNNAWEDHLIDIRTTEGKIQTKNILKNNAVFITRRKNHHQEDLNLLKEGFLHEKVFKNWILYY